MKEGRGFDVALAVAILVAALAAPPAHAATIGTTGASFLKLPVGARAEALGESGVVGLDGLESLYWNPAGLASEREGFEALFTHQNLWEDITATAFALGLPETRVGTFALGFQHLGVGTWNNLPGEPGVDAGDLAILVGFGRALTPRIEVGVTARTLHSTLGDDSANGFSLDSGVRYRWSDSVILAGAVRNLGSGFSYRGADADPLPTVGILGAGFHLARASFLAEARKERGADPCGAVGLELRPHSILALRVGSRLGSGEGRAPSDLSWGAGIDLPQGLRLDYSFRDSDFGGSYQLSAMYALGGGQGQASGTVVGSTPPSNLTVMRTLVERVADSLMTAMPAPEGREVVLRGVAAEAAAKPPGKEDAGSSATTLVESVLTGILTSRGIHVRLAGTQSDSAGAKTAVESAAPVLEYRVLDLKISYPSGSRRHFVGQKEMHRVAVVNLDLRLFDRSGGTVEWAGAAERSYEDVVPFRLLEALKAEGFAFPEAETPEQKWDRVLEPLVATAIVGGLIYLFYSNKGSE